jgi:ubiquitin carboxyl-terminal hydrolase 4/11
MEGSKDPMEVERTGNAEKKRSTSVEADDGPGAVNGASSPIDEDMPDLEEQIAKVQELHATTPQEGDTGYIISTKWLARVFSRSVNAPKGEYDKEASEGEIGAVDSSDLLAPNQDPTLKDERGHPYVRLRADIVPDNYEIVPEEAWRLVKKWYGVTGNSEIPRYAHKTVEGEALLENVQYELHPPIFTIRKTRDDSGGVTLRSADANQSRAPRVLCSRNANAQNFLKQIKEAAGIDMSTKVQVWRVVEAIGTSAKEESDGGPSGMLTPATSRSGSPSSNNAPELLIDAKSFFEMAEGQDRELVDIQDHTNNNKYNGHLQIRTLGLAADAVIILDPKTSGGSYASEVAQKSAEANGITLKPSKAKALKDAERSASASGRNSPTPSVTTRGRRRKDGRVKGTVGLMNLGNTCYMNSALQCMRSVEELTLYFLRMSPMRAWYSCSEMLTYVAAENHYKEELNPNNPLGYGGQIAKSYASLLASIYNDGDMNSFRPQAFKATLGRAQPTFSGYGQQDSQEFMSFLVDGLHEDLNRIQKKPYIENPESDDNTVNDPEAIKALGEKFREIHRKRNDSVAMDLFNGFYKNTMVCPDCQKVSITFDPFSLLTLQLPIEQSWQHAVRFVPQNGPPVNIEIDVGKNEPLRAIKDFIIKRIPGLDSNRLIMAEVYTHKFYRIFEDDPAISESNIADRDEIVMYELAEAPTNFPPKKKKNKFRSMVTFSNGSSDEEQTADSPFADRLAVPVFHRKPNRNSWSADLRPTFITLNREEAKDYDTILRKVVNSIAGMTTRDILSDSDSPFKSSNGSDAVLTTDEDASSNTDSRVQAHSVEGEESIVDVSMADAPEPSADQKMDTDQPTQSTVTSALEPGSFIPPELRGLFQMKIMSDRRSGIPTGWHGLNENYPSVESRIPQQPVSRQSSVHSQSSNASGSTASNESQETPPQFTPNQSFPGDVESDDDTPRVAADFRRHNPKKAGRRQQMRGGKRKQQMYSKKGKRPEKSFVRHQPESPPSEPDDDPALIRLGEGIIIDWTTEAFDALFGGIGSDDLRGSDTWDGMQTLPDPELEAKRATRAARKKNGITLEDCFAETAKGEILSEDNAWYCNRCKELRRASKTLDIWTVPDILVIHLKRFSQRSFRSDKVDILVDFPTEGLDLSGKVGLNEGKGLVYDLFAVDNHYGGLGGGHYTAYAQNFYDKKWYDYNGKLSFLSSAIFP